MSSGPAILGIAGLVTFGNEWLQDEKLNWLVIPATAFGMIGLSLVEKISPVAATGLATIALLTELMVSFNGKKTPLQELMDVMGYSNRKKG